MKLTLKRYMNRQEAREMLAMHKCPFYGCEEDECGGLECVNKFFDMYEQTEGYKFADQNREFFEECVKTAEKYGIKDSGNRTEFSTGAVRDVQEDKGRFDLAPLGVIARLYSSEPNIILNRINDFMESGDTEYLLDAVNRFVSAERKTVTEMMLEVSVHYMKGAKKYKPYNWMLGIPVSSYISSGVRHFLKHIDGHMDERHDLAFIWNMLGAVWTMEHKPEMIDIPFELIGGKTE